MLIKLGKAQSTAEYAILISVVIAAAMAVQTYVKRTLETRVKQAADQFILDTGGSLDGGQWHGQEVHKVTTGHTSRETFTEDYARGDMPFEYTSWDTSTFTQVTVE